MKSAMFILMALAIVVMAKKRTNEEIEQLKKWHSECGEDKETKDLLNKARNGEWIDNPKLGTHLLCYSKKLGWLNEEGKFDVHETKKNFEKYYDEDQVQKLMSNCIKEKTHPEDTAVALFKCRQTVLH
ncbi:unnamed protein product [Brassicogethes aeneus]|uniref:Uncharacterized protein n=1 Tax=Brassicogethes aeneus TaxID=1431903 RepID=A0A9P0BCC0_BRAAE|nr:unnamed protein product [Brassicogethes aeneus]